MQKRPPTLANILVILLFALSCFGLLLFLWESFGGPLPLKPKGYRFVVDFSRTEQLAEQSDVRINGVEVGHVVSLALDNGKTRATIEIANQYAPIRSNDHVLLRLKTLLGETYVEITPGGSNAPVLPDGGQLADSRVEPFVTLDEILTAFDPKTRKAFQEWMQESATSFNGRGEALNASIASLDPFVEHAKEIVALLAEQEGAVREIVHNTGVVFNALAGREGQLRGLIVNGEHTFNAAARSSQAFADAIRALPAFESSSQTALRSLDSFATDATPLLDQLRPVERELAPTLKVAETFAPRLDAFVSDLGPLTKASKKGLPDFTRILDLLTPVLGHLTPVLHNLDPFLQYVGEYEPELQSFFANLTAATQASDVNSNVPEDSSYQHYMRSMQGLSTESLAVVSHAVGVARLNPYPKSGAFDALGSGGLQVFSNSNCSDSAPTVSGPANATVSQSIIEQIVELHLANGQGTTSNSVPAPACNQQGPFLFNGVTSEFPHVIYTGN